MGCLLEQADQLGLLGEESVVAMSAGHLAVVGLGTGGTDGFGKAAHILGGKEPVGADADEAEARANAAEGFFR